MCIIKIQSRNLIHHNRPLVDDIAEASVVQPAYIQTQSWCPLRLSWRVKSSYLYYLWFICERLRDSRKVSLDSYISSMFYSSFWRLWCAIRVARCAFSSFVIGSFFAWKWLLWKNEFCWITHTHTCTTFQFLHSPACGLC